MTLQESVATALGQGKRKICVVSDMPRDRTKILEELSAFGEVPEESPYVEKEKQAPGSGIWGLYGAKVYLCCWGAQLLGRGFDLIAVTAKEKMESIHGARAIQDWENVVLRGRLEPGGVLEVVGQE